MYCSGYRSSIIPKQVKLHTRAHGAHTARAHTHTHTAHTQYTHSTHTVHTQHTHTQYTHSTHLSLIKFLLHLAFVIIVGVIQGVSLHNVSSRLLYFVKLHSH